MSKTNTAEAVETPTTYSELCAIGQAYAECAVWCAALGANGQYRLEDYAELDDIERSAIEEIHETVTGFAALAGDLLKGLDDGQIGHDLFLSSHSHGAGFFDRGLGAKGDKLQALAETMGETYPEQWFENIEIKLFGSLAREHAPEWLYMPLEDADVYYLVNEIQVRGAAQATEWETKDCISLMRQYGNEIVQYALENVCEVHERVDMGGSWDQQQCDWVTTAIDAWADGIGTLEDMHDGRGIFS